MTILEFCNLHDACAEGRNWALEQGMETMAELWELPMMSKWRAWIATRPGVLTPQQRVSWACRCVRRVWNLLEDERSKSAVEVAERWVRGETSAEELETARAAARAAATAAYTSRAAYDTAADAACAAAYAANAANAANAAACAAAGFDTERDWQARELVRMFGNPFKKG